MKISKKVIDLAIYRINQFIKVEDMNYILKEIDGMKISKLNTMSRETKKEMIIEKVKEKQNLDIIFDYVFLLTSDVLEMLEITQYKLRKLIDEGLIEVGYVSYTTDRKTFYYRLKDILEFKASHKKDIKEYNQKVSRIKQKRNVKIGQIPLTVENISEALYVINKSAKKSRDSKNQSMSRNVTKSCRTRMNNLYNLKEEVIELLKSMDLVEILGVHKQYIKTMPRIKRNYNYRNRNDYFDYDEDYDEDYNEDGYDEDYNEETAFDYDNEETKIPEIKENILVLFKFGNFTFHIPIDSEWEKQEVIQKYKVFDEELGIVSAEMKVKPKLKYYESVSLLNEFLTKKKIDKGE
ncbi:MAG: hypothetical protein MJ231_02230 [bacterium]|nr:hypothetical protein [bacterium]